MRSRPREAAAAGIGGGTTVLLLAVVALCLLAGGSARAVVHAAPGEGEGGLDVTHLRARGWQFPATLPRRLKLFVAEELKGDGSPIGDGDDESAYVHLGYSDGQSVVSVFIQRGRLDAARLANWHVRERFGHTIWVQGSEGKNAIWTSGDHVYTVFADAPADVVDSAVAALPHEAEPGFWQQLTRGVDRVIAWASPFA